MRFRIIFDFLQVSLRVDLPLKRMFKPDICYFLQVLSNQPNFCRIPVVSLQLYSGNPESVSILYSEAIQSGTDTSSSSPQTLTGRGHNHACTKQIDQQNRLKSTGKQYQSCVCTLTFVHFWDTLNLLLSILALRYFARV